MAKVVSFFLGVFVGVVGSVTTFVLIADNHNKKA